MRRPRQNECIVHLGAVLFEILRRDLPPTAVFGQDGRCVVLADRLSYADYDSQAFDEIRQSAVALLGLASALVETERGEALARHVRLVVAGVERASWPTTAKPVLDAADGLPTGLELRP